MLPHPPLPRWLSTPWGAMTLPAAAQRGPLTGNCYWMPQRPSHTSPRSSRDLRVRMTSPRPRSPPPPLACAQLLSWRPGPRPRGPALNKQVTCSLFPLALALLPRPASPRRARAAGERQGHQALTCSPAQHRQHSRRPRRGPEPPGRQQALSTEGQPCPGFSSPPLPVLCWRPLTGLRSQGQGWDWDAGFCWKALAVGPSVDASLGPPCPELATPKGPLPHSQPGP